MTSPDGRGLTMIDTRSSKPLRTLENVNKNNENNKNNKNNKKKKNLTKVARWGNKRFNVFGRHLGRDLWKWVKSFAHDWFHRLLL